MTPVLPSAIAPSKGENVLARIVADKREEVARLRSTEQWDTPERSTRSLEDALRRAGPSFIMECKKASPTLGPIRPDISLEDLASIYGPRADAISVLCDGKYFGGSFDDVRQMRQLVDVPILAKDFFIDPYQLYAARHAGAGVRGNAPVVQWPSRIEYFPDLPGFRRRDNGATVRADFHDVVQRQSQQNLADNRPADAEDIA